jgi:hypothetical protein
MIHSQRRNMRKMTNPVVPTAIVVNWAAVMGKEGLRCRLIFAYAISRKGRYRRPGEIR